MVVRPKVKIDHCWCKVSIRALGAPMNAVEQISLGRGDRPVSGGGRRGRVARRGVGSGTAASGRAVRRLTR